MARLNKDRIWLLVPFYSDPENPSHGKRVETFYERLQRCKTYTVMRVAVVDDGSKLNPSDLTRVADFHIQFPRNLGKAEAIRGGLNALISNERMDFVCQIDADGDQSHIDVPLVMNELFDVTREEPGEPGMIIGDRYTEELINKPNPRSLAYRQSALLLNELMAREMGYVLKDWQSGTRAYTRELAKRFVEGSKSEGYGIEAEQIAMAFLENARVSTVPLAVSRPRTESTSTLKIIQNIEGILAHKNLLEERGVPGTLVVLEELRSQLKEGSVSFEVDLSPLGKETAIRFERIEGSYTAEVSREYRMREFPSLETSFARGEKYTSW